MAGLCIFMIKYKRSKTESLEKWQVAVKKENYHQDGLMQFIKLKELDSLGTQKSASGKPLRKICFFWIYFMNSSVKVCTEHSLVYYED